MKKKSLLLRVTVLSLVLGMVAMLLSGGILYALFRSRAEANMKKKLNENVNRMAYQLIRYQSYDWLLPYWQEHYKKMALPPFGDIDTYLKWGEERGAFERLNAAALTPQEVMEMPETQQLLYADYCYLQIFFEISQLRIHSDIDVVACFAADESENEAFIWLQSTKEDKGFLEHRMALGQVWPFQPKAHPGFMELQKPDVDLNSGVEIVRSERDGAEYATVYAKLLSRTNHEMLGALSVSISTAKMLDEVWSDVFRFEKQIALLILILIVVILFAIHRTFLKPTLMLAQSIQDYTQHKSPEKLSEALKNLVNREDEIGRLACDARDMVEQNERYYKQRIENESLKSKILLAQIKPHFIYNCLTLIRSLLDEPEKAEEALNHFAGFLRGSVDMLEETVCISASREIQTVDDYLYLQKQRFGDSLRVVTDYRDTGFFLPPFTLQVLVENAVIHGIRNTAGGSGTVVIRSYEADGFHVIEVEDDGNGLPPEIRQEREQKEQTHVGLKNIERCLDLMCHGTLTIQNKTGQGTIATIRIPKQIDP
ncbi:MAG: histidine kinase [Oscillospiraceae bacterium]|jgi:sensor histidine kinase YesM|nr:histidine kinase [Oscillospiraceae bacterium]